MTPVATVLFVIGLLLVAGTILALVTAWPLLRIARERQAVERERRLAEWRLRTVTTQAMQELLRQARERP